MQTHVYFAENTQAGQISLQRQISCLGQVRLYPAID